MSEPKQSRQTSKKGQYNSLVHVVRIYTETLSWLLCWYSKHSTKLKWVGVLNGLFTSCSWRLEGSINPWHDWWEIYQWRGPGTANGDWTEIRVLDWVDLVCSSIALWISCKGFTRFDPGRRCLSRVGNLKRDFHSFPSKNIASSLASTVTVYSMGKAACSLGTWLSSASITFGNSLWSVSWVVCIAFVGFGLHLSTWPPAECRSSRDAMSSSLFVCAALAGTLVVALRRHLELRYHRVHDLEFLLVWPRALGFWRTQSKKKQQQQQLCCRKPSEPFVVSAQRETMVPRFVTGGNRGTHSMLPPHCFFYDSIPCSGRAEASTLAVISVLRATMQKQSHRKPQALNKEGRE